MRIAIVFDQNADGYRIGEYLDSDVQPVFLAYRDRDGNNVFLIEGEWTAADLAAALPGEGTDAE